VPVSELLPTARDKFCWFCICSGVVPLCVRFSFAAGGFAGSGPDLTDALVACPERGTNPLAHRGPSVEGGTCEGADLREAPCVVSSCCVLANL